MKYSWLDSARKHELNLGNISRGVSICLLTAASPALAGPTGGSVAAGSARIQNNGSSTVITQTTGRAVINWKDFSLGTNESVKFVDPSSSSVTLNRVTGGNTSQILGSISSNGQVFIVNPAGIVFGKTATVDVAGLLATTANITNSDFMKGNYHFTDAPAGSSVINEGSITIHDAGLGALVAPHVRNTGFIQATLGRVALA
ncbi:MAG: filamentous hemagglutinin N-terminal domain-containing protein, partial [Gammaproteobacteria bacterium]